MKRFRVWIMEPVELCPWTNTHAIVHLLIMGIVVNKWLMLVLTIHVNNKDDVKHYPMDNFNVIVFRVLQVNDVKRISTIVFCIDVKIMEHVSIKSTITLVVVRHFFQVRCFFFVFSEWREISTRHIDFLIGKYCEQKINWCEGNSNPCRNNGRCDKTNDGYQ